LWLSGNIIKFFLVLLSSYFKKPLTGPISVAVTVTWLCNSRCIMCDYPERADITQEFTTKEIEKIIDELKAIRTTGVTFFGGEPLLRGDIFHLIQYASKSGLMTQMPTNGILLSDKSMAEKLVRSGIDEITVSLDSSTKEDYRKIRNIDGFDKAIEGIKNLVELRKNVKYPSDISIISTITENNVDDIPNILRLAESLGVEGISIFPAQPVETLPNQIGEAYKKKLKNTLNYLITEKKRGNKIIDDSLGYLNYALMRLDNKIERIKCFAPYTDLHIDCFGNVFPCVSFLGLNKPFSNIRGKSLKEVWFSKETQQYRNSVERCGACEYMCQIESSLPFNKFCKSPSFL